MADKDLRLSGPVPKTLDVFQSGVQTNWLRLTGWDARFTSSRGVDKSILFVDNDLDLKEVDQFCARLPDTYYCVPLDEKDKSMEVSGRYAETIRLLRQRGLLTQVNWVAEPTIQIPNNVQTRTHLEEGERIIEARQSRVEIAGVAVYLERYLIDHDGDGRSTSNLDATLYIISKRVGDILNDPEIPPDIPSLTLIRVDNSAHTRLVSSK